MLKRVESAAPYDMDLWKALSREIGVAGLLVPEESVQLHGGIGMTWEHPLHLYLKRAKSTEIALGSPGAHRDALAVLADLPGPA